jgi:hypothetical protein
MITLVRPLRPQKKSPRAFKGLAGSPLAQVQPAEESLVVATPILRDGDGQQKRGRGRPRKHENDAEKQKAYRVRLQPKIQQEKKDTAILKALKDHRDRLGEFQGEQSGGNGADKIAGLGDLWDGEGTRMAPFRLHPLHHGPEADTCDVGGFEREDQFQNGCKFPLDWKLSEFEKDRILQDFAQQSFTGEEERCLGFDDSGEPIIAAGTLLCNLCSARKPQKTKMYDTMIEAIQHLETKHERDVKREWRRLAPRKTKRPKKPKCSSSDHLRQIETLTRQKVTGKVFCSACEEMIYRA